MSTLVLTPDPGGYHIVALDNLFVALHGILPGHYLCGEHNP